MSAAPTPPLHAGLASVDITPREPIWLDGWASRTGPSQGVSAPIHAKALALDDGGPGGVHVLVSCDLCGVSRGMTDGIARWAEATHSLKRSQLIVHVTHNHSGPRLSRDRGYFADISYDLADAQVQGLRRTVALIMHRSSTLYQIH